MTVRTFAYGVKMPEQQKTREQYMAFCVGLVLAVAVGALCVVFSLSKRLGADTSLDICCFVSSFNPLLRVR